MQKVLLVGGGGFIGSYIADMLASENVETVILDNFSSQFQRRTDKGTTVINGDMSDEKVLESALEGVTHVWHGAYPHNIASRVDDIETVWKNIRATTTLATIARRNKVKKFVYASSRSIYGNARYNPVDEKHPVQPVTAYGLCKAVCEEKLLDMLGKSETELCVLRGFLVYGPGDRQSVVTKFAQTIVKKEDIKIFGDGSATRDFIHVKDMARATVLAMKLENTTGVYNVGSGKETSLLQLVKLFGEVTGRKDITPQFIHTDAWNVNDRCFADTTLATRVLGFKPSISLKEGIRQVLQDCESRTGN
jgi:UDP-glucose 4-epimerase